VIPRPETADDSCPKSSALAIDCFEGRCVCGGAHADWMNYLCQCTAPYRNVDGARVSDVAAPATAKPEAKNPPDQTGEPSAEPARRRWGCWHGMIRLRGGCVPAHAVFAHGWSDITGLSREYYSRGLRIYRRHRYATPRQDR
jgi:hypothetical protein